MASFNEAFKKARDKFEKSGKESDFTFTWQGDPYTVRQKGESKKGLMSRFGGESDSTRPTQRPSSAPSSSDRPTEKGTRTSARPTQRPAKPTGNEASATSPQLPPKSPEAEPDSPMLPPREENQAPVAPRRKPTSKGRIEMRRMSGYNTGGMVGASSPPTQKGTPKFK